MEVFVQYFRRLLQSNASTIFSGTARSADATGGTYQLLMNEVQKLATEADQANKIAESLDTNDGELFKDFDVATFMDHFRLNAIVRTSLTLAIKNIAKKTDLKAKGMQSAHSINFDEANLNLSADSILSNDLEAFLTTLSEPSDVHDNIPPLLLASIIERLIQTPPRTWNDERKSALQYAIKLRYNRLNVALPYAVAAALTLADLSSPQNSLVRLIQQAGPHATLTLDSCKEPHQSRTQRHGLSPSR